MHFSIQRETLLKPLQQLAGIAGGKTSRPILGNVLLQVETDCLRLTATDTELSLQTTVGLTGVVGKGEITVPARKFIDICRTLPSDSVLQISLENNQVTIKTENAHFNLSTLPVKEFPDLETQAAQFECNIAENDFRYLLESTHFAMANNDARAYLNGLHLHIYKQTIDVVASDGHRLALCQIIDESFQGDCQIILPRKAVLELLRILSDRATALSLAVSSNSLRVSTLESSFTTRLLNGRFPDFRRAIPQSYDHVFTMDKDVLKEALMRVSILSNEKYRGVHLQIQPGFLRVTANNHDQEEAIEEIAIDYQGDDLDVGFNVSYLLDVLNNIPAGDVRLEFAGNKSGMSLHSVVDEQRVYLVMPMRV